MAVEEDDIIVQIIDVEKKRLQKLSIFLTLLERLYLIVWIMMKWKFHDTVQKIRSFVPFLIHQL